MGVSTVRVLVRVGRVAALVGRRLAAARRRTARPLGVVVIVTATAHLLLLLLQAEDVVQVRRFGLRRRAQLLRELDLHRPTHRGAAPERRPCGGGGGVCQLDLHRILVARHVPHPAVRRLLVVMGGGGRPAEVAGTRGSGYSRRGAVRRLLVVLSRQRDAADLRARHEAVGELVLDVHVRGVLARRRVVRTELQLQHEQVSLVRTCNQPTSQSHHTASIT